MAPPDFTSGSLPEYGAGTSFRAHPSRGLILWRLSLGTLLVWAILGVVTAVLWAFTAPLGFRYTFRGIVAGVGLLGLSSTISLLQVRRLGRLLDARGLGPASARPLTRFPQASSALFFYLGLCLSGGGYLWVKLLLERSLWASFITLAMFLVLATLGAISLYFVAKQNLMRAFRTLAETPGFEELDDRFTTSLRAKFGFGILGIAGGVLLLSILVSGLTLQSSIQSKVMGFATYEVGHLVDVVEAAVEFPGSQEDLEGFINTLKLGAGGGLTLHLSPARGGAVLGARIAPSGIGDVEVVRRLSDGSHLQAVIPEADYSDTVWKALVPNLVILLLAGAFLAYFIPLLLRDVQHPLLLLSRNAQQVSEGRIDRLAAVYSDDEVSSLVGGFGRMVASLRGMVVQIRTASRELSKATALIRDSGDAVRQSNQGQRVLIDGFHREINQLTETSVGISASSAELSLASESTTATITEMAASGQQINRSMDELLVVVEGITAALRDFDVTIKDVGRNIDHLAGHAEHTREFAENLEQSTSAIDDSVKIAQRYTKKVIHNAGRGMELVARNREKIQVIERVVKDFHGTTRSLLQMGSEIAKILDYIGDHAQQTNMLALNAAIIASQGGTGEGQARGFSVVADEIKHLAEQTGRSTQEIQQIIGALQTEIRKAYQQVELGLDAVRDGADSVAQSEVALQAILESVSETDSVVAGIRSEALQQAGQASLIHEANRNIHRQAGAIRSVIEEQQQTSNYILSLAMNVQQATAVVRDSTREQGIGSDEIASATEQVSSLAGHLHEILGRQEAHVHALKETINRVLGKAIESEGALEVARGAVDQLGVRVHLLNREVNLFKL